MFEHILCLWQIVLFTVTEVVPIVFSLQKTLVQRLSDKSMDPHHISGNHSANNRDTVANTTGFGPAVAMFGGSSSSSSSHNVS